MDGRRIGIGGHSFGGLVTVIAATKRPDVAGVLSINGGITWIQTGVQEGYPAVSAVWRAEAKGLSAPILLLHGRDDAVVTPELSRELAGLLERRGVQVTFKLIRVATTPSLSTKSSGFSTTMSEGDSRTVSCTRRGDLSCSRMLVAQRAGAGAAGHEPANICVQPTPASGRG